MTPSISLPKLPAHLVTELRFVQGCLENDFIEATVFLAGGCVRDVIIGRHDPKDVDVFIIPKAIADFNNASIKLAMLKDVECNSLSSSRQGNSKEFLLKNRKLDIVVLEPLKQTVWDVLESFDIGLCQVAYADKCFILHENFVEDLNQECIRVRGLGNWTVENVKVRVEKFKGYYPDFMVDNTFLKEAK